MVVGQTIYYYGYTTNKSMKAIPRILWGRKLIILSGYVITRKASRVTCSQHHHKFEVKNFYWEQTNFIMFNAAITEGNPCLNLSGS